MAKENNAKENKVSSKGNASVSTKVENKKSSYGPKQKSSFVQKKYSEAKDYLLDHEKLHATLSWTWLILITIVSAFCFSYGYRAFISPASDGAVGVPSLISGGASGISQIILRIMQIGGYDGNENIVTSISYFILNIPILILAVKAIGKRFAVLTILNVVLTSIFIRYIPDSWATILSSMDNDYIARAMFAGLLTGVSSGLAFFSGASTGGIDVISFYIAEKKSTTVGKYSIIINACVVLTYTFVNGIRISSLSEVAMSLYTVVYFFTASKILDLINIKNKKTELQINTDNLELAPILLRAFPHGCTVIDAVGGYTGKPRKVIYMVVSASEVKEVVKVARKIDSSCFVNVTNSMQVYGKFYVKPIQ